MSELRERAGDGALFVLVVVGVLKIVALNKTVRSPWCDDDDVDDDDDDDDDNDHDDDDDDHDDDDNDDGNDETKRNERSERNHHTGR